MLWIQDCSAANGFNMPQVSCQLASSFLPVLPGLAKYSLRSLPSLTKQGTCEQCPHAQAALSVIRIMRISH